MRGKVISCSTYFICRLGASFSYGRVVLNRIERILWIKVFVFISIILVAGMIYRMLGHVNQYILRGMDNVVSFGYRMRSFMERLSRRYTVSRRVYDKVFSISYYEVIILYLHYISMDTPIHDIAFGLRGNTLPTILCSGGE